MSGPPPDRDARVCAVCGKRQTPQFKPFCSKHCADVDLGRWFRGAYAIPAQELAETLPDAEDDDSG